MQGPFLFSGPIHTLNFQVEFPKNEVWEWQEYLVFDVKTHAMLPLWMTNTSLGEASEWKHLPVKLLPPALTPDSLSEWGVVLEVAGPPESLVKPAIKAGVYLTVPQLSAVQKQVKYLLPAEGSGAHGALIKIDYATAIVKHYFADLSPDSPEFQAMVSAIMGGSKPKVRCPKEVLIALKSLSAEEREGFEELEQVVANQEKLRKVRLKAASADQVRKWMPTSICKALIQPSGSWCLIFQDMGATAIPL